MTKMQKLALEKMASRDGGSAYSLGIGLGTLNSLALKKFVRADRSALGSMFSPRTSIAWYITDEGRKAYRRTNEPQP